MMPYAITDSGWRAIEKDWILIEGETYSRTLPPNLLIKDEHDERARLAMSTMRELQSLASYAITPLQAVLDVGEISEEDYASWRKWKQYVILLSQTPAREGWPDNPDWPTTLAL